MQYYCEYVGFLNDSRSLVQCKHFEQSISWNAYTAPSFWNHSKPYIFTVIPNMCVICYDTCTITFIRYLQTSSAPITCFQYQLFTDFSDEVCWLHQITHIWGMGTFFSASMTRPIHTSCNYYSIWAKWPLHTWLWTAGVTVACDSGWHASATMWTSECPATEKSSLQIFRTNKYAIWRGKLIILIN